MIRESSATPIRLMMQGYYQVLPPEGDQGKAANILCLFTFFVTIGLTALAVWIEHSAWPLFGISPAIAGGFVGYGVGYFSAKDEPESASSASEDHASADEEEEEEDEKEEEEEEKEQLPKERLEWAAWWVGAVGAFRCWSLLSDSDWSDMFDSFSLGQFDSPRELVLGLSGPVILIAAIAMYHARFYWFAVTACTLCTLSGSCPAVVCGGWSLITLFDPTVRALFLAKAQALSATRAAGTDLPKPAKSPLPRGYGDAIGSTLGNAWTDWWRERDSLFTKSVQTFLMLVHIGCLLAFLGFSGTGGTNDQGQREFKHHIGYPSPWYTLESTSQPGGPFNQSTGIQWYSSAWLVAACGLGLAYVYCRIEKVRNPAAGFWHKPETFMLAWVVLAIADIGLGVGMGQLETTFKTQDDSSVTEPIGSSQATGQKVVAGEIEPSVAALLQAAATGRISAIRKLLAEGADVNDKNADGQTH